MRGPSNRWRRLLWLAAGLALLLGLLALPLARKASVERKLSLPLAAVMRAPAAASGTLRESWQSLWRLRAADRENQRLKAENTLLKLELADARQRLRRLAPREAGQFEWAERPAIAAAPLARDPSTWFNFLTLDKGRADGVAPGAGVVAPEGVVGKMVSVTDTSGKMVFLFDPSCRIAVRVARSGVAATLAGSGRRTCVLQYLAGQDDVRVGDLVETAEGGSIFPPGVPVGVVARVEKREAGLNLFAEVKPFARPSLVQAVYVLPERP